MLAINLKRIFRSKAVWVAGGVLLLIIVAQLLYPAGRIVPLSRLDGSRVGNASQKVITDKLIRDYRQTSLLVETKGGQKDFTEKVLASEAGLSPDAEKIYRNLSAYPWWQRIIPGSFLVRGLTKNQDVIVKIDDEQYKSFAKTYTQSCEVRPKSAGVVIKNGTAELDPAKSGQKCEEKTLHSALVRVKLAPETVKVAIKPVTTKPDRSDKDVESLLSEADELTKRKLSLKLLDKSYEVPREELASWVVFDEDPKDKKKVVLDISTDPIRKYVTEMQKKIYVAPTVTTVKTVDSEEQSRVEGESGRGLDHTATAAALKEQLKKGNGEAEGVVIAIPSRVVYERSYSATRAGLAAMIKDLAVDKGDYGISVRFMDGTVLSGNGDKKYHPASTYKLYLSYSILKRIDDGRMKWDDGATGGKTIAQCFEVMIVNSDNPCAEWFGWEVGWGTAHKELASLGLSNTNMAHAQKSSTANDETLFLYKLVHDNIVKTESRDKLIDLMKRQVYRNGIPKGVGVEVADKVGFLDGLLHDSGVVYAPGGAYTMSIMTMGSSWAQIADTARQIQQQIEHIR